MGFEPILICFRSQVGTGGMDSKVMAATWAMDRGVSVVICNGMQEKAVKTIVGGRKVGTFFTESVAGSSNSVEAMAENGNRNCRIDGGCCGADGVTRRTVHLFLVNWWLHIKTAINFHLARIGSRKLQTISAAERAAAVNTLADLLTSKQQRILEANALDLAEATKAGIAKPLLSRLSLSAAKLNNLATGLRQIADSSEKVSYCYNTHRGCKQMKTFISLRRRLLGEC